MTIMDAPVVTLTVSVPSVAADNRVAEGLVYVAKPADLLSSYVDGRGYLERYRVTQYVGVPDMYQAAIAAALEGGVIT